MVIQLTSFRKMKKRVVMLSQPSMVPGIVLFNNSLDQVVIGHQSIGTVKHPCQTRFRHSGTGLAQLTSFLRVADFATEYKHFE